MCPHKYLLTLALIHPLLAESNLTAGFRYEFGLGRTSYAIPSAPGWGLNYSFRPRPWLEVEAGLDQVPRPVGSSVCCRYVSNANDQLYLAPFGARYRWESHSGRLSL